MYVCFNHEQSLKYAGQAYGEFALRAAGIYRLTVSADSKYFTNKIPKICFVSPQGIDFH